MTTTAGEIATRHDIEAALWRWSEWRADHRGVAEVMALIDQYAGRDLGAERAASDLLACARAEAEQIVQSARDEAAVIRDQAQDGSVRPSTTLTELDPANVSWDVWRDARGAVWVRLAPAPAITGERTQKCTECGKIKGELLFRPDTSSTKGRRTQCRDCENEKRRDARLKKQKR